MDARKIQIGLLEGKSNFVMDVKGVLDVLEGNLQTLIPVAENTSLEQKFSYTKNLADVNQTDSSALLIQTDNMTQKTLETVFFN